MKNLNSILFIALLFFVQQAFAQSISINHQYQGTSFSSMSKGNHKVGFVTCDTTVGNVFVVNYMDSLQNMVSTIDSNITPSLNFLSGDVLLTAEMDPNDHLWGLFFDQSLYNLLNAGVPQTSIYTFFLYDFDNHQKHYLDVQPFIAPPFYYGPTNTSINNINFLNDTIYISMGMTEFDPSLNLIPRQIIIRWSNGNQISTGSIGFMATEVVMGYNDKLTHVFDGTNIYQSLGSDVNNNAIGYNQNIPINNTLMQMMTSETYDACTHNGTTYMIGFASDFLGTYPSFEYLILKNNIFDTVINIPTSGLNNRSSVTVDHANRVWVYDGNAAQSSADSLFMYDGTGWLGFSLQGANIFSNYNIPYPWEFHIVEYAHNRFMMNVNMNGFHNGTFQEIGDGILFFDYNDPLDSNLNHIQGRVFYDSNGNGTLDNGEPPIANQIINAGGTYTNTYNNGFYNLYVPNGAQTIAPANLPVYLNATPSFYNFNFIITTDTLGNNFAIQHSTSANDLQVNLTPGIHRTFQNNWYSLMYKNTGSSASNGNVSLVYNPLMSFVSSTVTPTTNTSGNLTWDFTNLQPFETRQIYFSLSPNNNFNIGDTVYAQVSITPIVGDATPANNTDSTMSIFIGSYDPNMKVVTQNGAEVNTILNDDPLEYVIHFQNVGNDTAFTVVITDTISNLLDLSTLEIIGSSHANYWGIYNRTLQFTFTGINLPDSGTNQLASNGFVSYRIKPVANISMGNVINNTAAIYFDVNAPVITNNAEVTLIDVTGIKEEVTSLIKVVPNPAQQIIYILGKNNQNQTATIYDAVGKVVLRRAINNNQSIDISGLSKGIYFIEVTGQRVKFVKE
jgi:uncharacterized repeat protein (TIGR01451 family)